MSGARIPAELIDLVGVTLIGSFATMRSIQTTIVYYQKHFSTPTHFGG